MLKIGRKSTIGRVGALCLVVFGMTVMSCQQEPVTPQIRPSTDYVIPTYTPTDSVRVNDDEDHPPKDVDDGGKGH